MENDKISIIVPVYNTEKYLEKCVDSLRSQTYQNLEILLVDDGSEDNSGKLCGRFAGEDSRIRVIHKKNGGLISAWKAGFAASSGAYVSFVDSDDFVDAEMIAEMAEHLIGDDKEMIVSDYVIERDNGSHEYVWQELPPGEYPRKEIEEKVIPNLLGREKRYLTVSRCMKLIARGLIEENQKYSNPAVVMGEDVTVMLPSFIDCNRLVVMEHKAYYHYLYVKESMVHKYDKNLYQKVQLLKQTVLQIVNDKFAGKEQKLRQKQLDQEMIFWMMLVLKNEARGNPKGYRKNILTICKSEEIRKLIDGTTVAVSEKANKLLYLVMKHPNHVTVSLLRLAMLWYYRKA